MRGLDNYIMGINDPNAPFNQCHWTEMFDNVLGYRKEVNPSLSKIIVHK